MEDGVPDLYTDAVQIGVSAFGVALSFAKQPAVQTGGMPATKVCTLRMSLEHAKVMAILIRKNLKQFEETMGKEVPLHPQVLAQLGLSRQEDW